MKRFALIISTLIAILLLSITVFAGTWEQDTNGWKWKFANGTYAKDGWQWCDGNGDGVAESYYFDAKGYCLRNTTTPDGYKVNADGAWVKDGKVQTQQVAATVAGSGTTGSTAKADTKAAASSYVLNTNTKKFHLPNCKSVSQMKAKNKKNVTDTREHIISQGYEPCKNCHP